MKDESATRPKHLQEHATPTVIHHPEENDTLLAQWLRRGIEKGPTFWLMLAGVVAVVIVVGFLVQGIGGRSAAVDDAWTDLMLASSPEERLKAAEVPGPASSWAYLQAAEGRYQEAFNDLPANRDAALPLLTRAYDLFEKAFDAAPDGKDVPQKRMAAMGMARTLEARGDLESAIKRYKDVARDYKDTDEGKRAAELAAALQKPEVAKFYRDFAAFKPETFTLPPRGRSALDLPLDHPPLDGPTIPAPLLPVLPGKAATAPSGSMPTNPFETSPTPPPAPTPPPDTKSATGPESDVKPASAPETKPSSDPAAAPEKTGEAPKG
jgi:hypothetical protein